MTRTTRHRLTDVIDAIDKANAILHGKTLTDLECEAATHFAIQMLLVIIAEAANNLPKDLLAAYPATAWSDIIGMGVRIKHHYYRVDPRIMWDAVTKDFPDLRATVTRMLVELEKIELPA